MSVLRQDPTTGGWVIVAPSRQARPHETSTETPGSRDRCPLCPGHEEDTPVELWRHPASKAEPWAVRVVQNKFAVLSPSEGKPRAREKAPLLRELDGIGHHELIIDGPRHDERIAQMSRNEVAPVLDAYHARYMSLRGEPRVAYIIVFKNSGIRAGASLTHPHSQLVATPMAPLGLERRYTMARSHYDKTDRCLYCELIDIELEVGLRIVRETERFVVFCPFASGVPFETWIAPKRHQPSFGVTSVSDRIELAALLQSTLGALDEVLQQPDFNYVLHTAPVADEDKPYYLWHLQILPRITTLAGFELGSGIPINTAFPEDAARALRNTAALEGTS